MEIALTPRVENFQEIRNEKKKKATGEISGNIQRKQISVQYGFCSVLDTFDTKWTLCCAETEPKKSSYLIVTRFNGLSKSVWCDVEQRQSSKMNEFLLPRHVKT